MLNLPTDDDLRQLAARLAETGDHDLVLTVEEEQAYQRIATRLNLLLADGNPLQRWLY